MVELGDEKYAISLGGIQTIEDIPVSEIKYVQTKEVVNLRGTVIPLIRLDSVLDIEHAEDDESLTVVVVKKGDKLAGTRIIPLVIEKEKMDHAREAAGKAPIFSILPYKKKKIGNQCIIRYF